MGTEVSSKEGGTGRTSETADVARGYFAAVAAQDLDGMVSHWSDGGVDRFVGFGDLRAPDEIRDYFSELFAAFPAWHYEVVDLRVDGECASVRWRANAVFAGPGSFQGLEPNGARVEIEGCDVTYVRDGKIQSNHAYFDRMDMARQLGALPAQDSSAERGMAAALNVRTRLARRLSAGEPELIAEGVWLLRGGLPRTMNAYLIEDNGRVTLFDAGIKGMKNTIAAAAARLGGLERVVLSHAHADHRGGVRHLGAPVICHLDEVADVERDGNPPYFDFGKLTSPPARLLMPPLHRFWDGGPAKVSGTVTEGDEIAGFRVLHLPGHAPGLIGLWRESDRLALTSDCFHLVDLETGRRELVELPPRRKDAMAAYTIANLKEIEDQAPRLGFAPNLEARFATVPLELRNSGLSYQRLAPSFRIPFGHTHKRQEELYLVVSGSARAKLDDEVVELRQWDALRVPSETMRALEGGPEGAEIIAFGAPNTGASPADDVEMKPNWWSD
jgi:glyoxylase-like metal-dependent hydrolase (beta-lactamase superfamily II)/predicted ester cyclase/mannose-6-phosphate isomerase-like protein (cupin superfamily)